MSRHHRVVAWVLFLTLAPFSALAQAPGREGSRSEAEEREILVEKLKRDITKVTRAIEVTEELIARSRGAPYLPDIYLRLAELYVEQSRYEFYLVNEDKEEGGAAVAPTARLLKEKAIETYRRIMDEFPRWEDNDKVLFYLAHELRELGEYDRMIATYETLAREHPKSELVLDAYVVLGDYRFDKADLDGAEVWYRKILDAPRSPTHDLAHFKMGWIELNRTRFRRAFNHFEAAVRSPWALPGEGRDEDRRLDVKREALADLAYTYTEVKAPQHALRYFRRLAPSRNLYVLALDKLANRYFVKEDYVASARIYRELARLSHDPVENLNRTSQVYRAVVQSKAFGRVDQDVRQLLDAADQYRFDWRVSPDERSAATRDAELQARDLVTRAQQVAADRRDRALGRKVADAYRRYLQSFPDGERQTEVVANLADTLYEAKRFLEAGDRYEEAARLHEGESERREALYNACAAFRQAIEVAGPTMPRFDRLWAQRGLIQNGRVFVEENPQSPKVPEIELSIGRSYFEGGEFERAVGVFEEFLDRHPRDRRVETVADLILDAYAQRKDYAGLAEKARALAELGVGSPAFAKRMRETAKAAEERQIGEVILTASVDAVAGEDAGDRLRRYWKDNPSSPVAEKTLYTAFVQYKEARDLEQLFETGNQFIGAYPKSQFLGDVFGTLAAFSSQVGRFDQAAVYLEEYASRFPGDASALQQRDRAARIRQLLGDHEGAARALKASFEGARSSAQRAEIGRDLLKSLRELERWGEARAVAQTLARDRSEASVLAQLVLGLAARRSGDVEGAARAFGRAKAEAGRGASDEVKADAAEAAFRLGETILDRFRQASALPDPAQAVATKVQLLPALEEAMVDAVGFGVGQWAVAGLHRVAMAYAEMAGFLAEAPIPSDLTPEEQVQYGEALEAQVAELEARAEELFGACVDRGVTLGVISPETKGCTSRGPAERIAAVPPSPAAPTGAEARQELEASLTRRPDDLDAIRALVEHLLASGEPARAKLMAGRGLELDDRDARLHNLVGTAELALGDATAAHAAFSRAAELGHPYAAANRITLLAEVGAESAARELLEAEDPDDVPDRAVDLHPRALTVLQSLR